MSKSIAVAGATALFAIAVSGPAQAQLGGFLDSLKQRAQDAVQREAEEAARKAAEPSAGDKPAPARADDPKKQALPPKAADATKAGAADAAAPAASAEDAGAVYDNKFDFVPGEQVILFDDFADTDVGDLPARWSIKGYEAGGAPMSVVQWQGRKWFSAEITPEQYSGGAYLRLQGPNGLPPKFTMEFDIAWGGSAYTLTMNDQSCQIEIRPDTMSSRNMSTKLTPRAKSVEHVSIMVNQNYVKGYLGGQRTINDNDCLNGNVTNLRFNFGDARSVQGPLGRFMMTNFRLAEGGKDFLTALNTDGRIVTHGISFDTNSDVIKPESGPTLRKMLQVLQGDAALKLQVQGHTDNQGGDAVNLPLSERRAKAVKAWLVAQGVDDKRLTTKGLGASKPIGNNASAEGRANNRRVEFVKL